jgi:D-3-phosphoglycerate dehydrogenase
MHQGIWNKSASNCYEVRGKKLGIIGYGKIGSQLSVLAESIGMDVYFYNHVEKLVLGNAKPCHSIDELLKKVDVVSVHIDGRLENTNFMNKERINLMKKGSYLINLSRGNIVDIDALTEALNSGHLAGAALDVYPEEPKSNTNNFQINLQNIPNVILTPHIGGSTEEAQLSIGKFVADKLTKFVDTGETTLSVNFPEIKLPELKNAYRLIHVHRNVPGIMAQINNIFAEEEINIEGQYLKTNGEIGYVITDINRKGSENAIERLKQIKETIRVRILY